MIEYNVYIDENTIIHGAVVCNKGENGVIFFPSGRFKLNDMPKMSWRHRLAKKAYDFIAYGAITPRYTITGCVINGESLLEKEAYK